jgi:quercetin dioxygenase-like cupin family protein
MAETSPAMTIPGIGVSHIAALLRHKRLKFAAISEDDRLRKRCFPLVHALKHCRPSLSEDLGDGRIRVGHAFISTQEKFMVPVIASDKLERAHVQGSKDKTVNWAGAFATCGGRHAVQSSTIVYEIEPGGHLGWHTDATEETQYIIAGTGELRMEDGTHVVGPGSVFALPANVRHDLANVGKDTLRAVAFFSAAMFTQTFDEVMLPPNTHVLGTPNREG